MQQKTKKQLICDILDIADRTFYKFKTENRPIIQLLEHYFDEDDLQEFLSTRKISKLDNIDNIAYLVKQQIDDKIELPNTLQLFFIDFYSILKEIYNILDSHELSDFYLILLILKDKKDSIYLNLIDSNIKYKYLITLICQNPFIESMVTDLHKSTYDYDFYSLIINNVNLSFTQKKDYLNHFQNFCNFR